MFYNIRIEMLKHGEKNKDVADIVHLSLDAASKRIQGVREWKIDELKLLSNHWGVSIDYLVRD